MRWRSSFSSRVFSMAMTACVANVLANSISRSPNGSNLRRPRPITTTGSPSRMSGTPIIERFPSTLASSFFS